MKNIILFLFLILLFVALLLNIIIINSSKTPKVEFFTEIDGIYLDKSMLNDEMNNKINELIASNNSAVFSQLVKGKDPTQQFYGFVGFMKSNQKLAINYLGNLLVSSKQVIILKNSKKIESTLGYAILLLIEEMPEWLTNKPIDDFYNLTESKILDAYNSSLPKNDSLYNDTLVYLIKGKYPNITKTIFKETLSFDNLKSKTLEEKIKLSSMINSASNLQREQVIIDLLQERNDKISLNVLNAILETDTTLVADEIYQIMKTSLSNEILIISVKKYALIYKNLSVPNLQIFMKGLSPSKEQLILTSLEQIYNYGDKNSYDFLKIFLETSYSSNINLYAIKTMIQTTYKTATDNMVKTFLFVIRYYEVELVVLYTINFFTDNNIGGYHELVLSRLDKMSSLDAKSAGLRYIEHFTPKNSLNYLKKLSNDESYDIKSKALQLIDKIELNNQ